MGTPPARGHPYLYTPPFYMGVPLGLSLKGYALHIPPLGGGPRLGGPLALKGVDMLCIEDCL
jgi:hypothetical protein